MRSRNSPQPASSTDLLRLPCAKPFTFRSSTAMKSNSFTSQLANFQVEVSALSGDFKVQLGNLPAHPSPSLRTLHLPAQKALFCCNLLLGLFEPSWIVSQRPVGESQKVLHANVYADGFSCRRQGCKDNFVWNFQSESSIPTVGFSGYPDLFDDGAFRQRTMPDDFNHADSLDIKAHSSTFIGFDFRTVTVGELQSSKAVRLFEARVADFAPFFGAAEEPFEGFIQATQDMLAGGEVEESEFFVRIPAFFKFVGLVAVGNGSLFGLPHGLSLGEGSVVEAAGDSQQFFQQSSLGSGGLETILVSQFHRLTPLLRCKTNLSNRADIVRPAPEGWPSSAQFRKLLPENSAGIALKAKGRVFASEWTSASGRVE